MNSWLNQKRFGGNNKIAGVSVNLGATKGRGSSTRVFNYCKQTSKDPSQCINQFITIKSSGSSGCTNIENIALSSIATESPSGTWTLNSNTTITICQSLTIGDGLTLIITEGLTLTNYGTITNNGGDINNNGGTITNNGIINNGGESTINIDLNGDETVGGIMTNNGTINNDGVIRCSPGAYIGDDEYVNNTINNSGYFYNNFRLYIEEYSNFTNMSGGTFNNNFDIFITGVINNISGSTFNNSSDFTLSDIASIGNSGTFNNSTTIRLTESSTIVNLGTFNNNSPDGNLIVYTGCTFNNSSANPSLFYNYAIVSISGGSLINGGARSTDNNIFNIGGTITNTGVITNYAGNICYNTNGGTIIQNGTFTNSGTIYNPIGSPDCGTGIITGTITGRIINACGAT